MKRLACILLVLCLTLGMASLALAAKATITVQPVTTTVKKDGNVTFTVEAKNVGSGTAITWYFRNPATGKETTGKKLGKTVPGVKVVSPNSLSITLKKVPESMHGWTLYCHIGPKGNGVNSDTVMILIEGLEVPAETPVPSSVFAASGEAEEDARATAENGLAIPSVPTPTPKPEQIVISGNDKFDLYLEDNKGNLVGDAQQQLVFTGGSANFRVRVPEGTEGFIKYVSIGGVHIYPEGEVRGMSIRGWQNSASVRVRVAIPGEEETSEESEALVLPEITPVPEVDASSLVTVTCTNCRFTGYTSTFAESGQVPVGTTITVFASNGVLSKGYFINGAKKGTNKNAASFQMIVEGDTTITMDRQK